MENFTFWLVILRILSCYLGKGLLKSQGGYELRVRQQDSILRPQSLRYVKACGLETVKVEKLVEARTKIGYP